MPPVFSREIIRKTAGEFNRTGGAILLSMRVMILPSMCVPDTGSAIQLARNLAALLRMEHIETAVSADKHSGFSDISFFEAPAPSVLSRRLNSGTTIEEYMKAHGAFSASYFSRDHAAIEAAITEYEPDLLIEIERPAAIVSARIHAIPLFSIVSPAVFRNRRFKADLLNGINEFLSEQGLEQILAYRELYAFAQCFAFGPREFLSAAAERRAACFGMSSIAPILKPSDGRLSIVLNDTSLSSRKRRKVITDAFLGAPYDVYVFSRGLRPGRNGNLHFLQASRFLQVSESRVCIHDGSDAITAHCIALGIPQIIIHDDSWQRSWNAAALKRSKAGLTVPEAEFSMSSVYETYRMLVSDDRFEENAERLRDEAVERGDLANILAYL